MRGPSEKRHSLIILTTSLFVVFAVVMISLVFVKLSPHSSAISMSNWWAGRIIDDRVFYDSDSMSEADIQNWLDARLACDTDGVKTSELGGGIDYNGDGRISRAEWAKSVYGFTGKFICLNTYYENPTTFENNLSTGVTPAGAISAAAIIKRAADDYNVSPKVLLVKLRKESPGPLTADEWPLPSQFDAAIGYACPDPPAGQPVVCNPAYKGFYRQLSTGAWQIKNYKVNSQSFRYKPFQSNYIQYNPDPGCGGTNVYIENFATAGLYNYTPYQPNPGALANYPGTAPCGAYGNRNFWAFYIEWFGSTLKPQTNSNDPTSSWPLGTSDSLIRASDGSAWLRSYDSLLGGWQPWRKIGGTLGSEPFVMNQNNDRLDVFAAGPAGDLIHTWSEFGLWRTWVSLGWPATGVSIVGTPGAVSWSNGRIDVFARGSDGHLWQRWYDASFGGWQPWAKHSITISSSPTVSSWAKGRLDVFFTNQSGNLQHYYYNNGWKNGNPLGQPSQSVILSTAPGAVSWSNGRIDVFARGSDGHLWQRWYDASFGGWQPWAKHSITISSSPTVSSWAKGRLDVFSKDPNSETLHHYWYGYGYGWASGLGSLGKP